MRILVLGIGNVMFGDEGFGVHFVRWAKECFSWEFEKPPPLQAKVSKILPCKKR